MKIHIHGGSGSQLYAFNNTNTALNDYTGPVGFQIGSRNNLRQPRATSLDTGLSKEFPVVENIRVKLRGDAFNVMNHPTFGGITTDITQSSNPFGVLTSDGGSRVLQVSLRVEF